MSVQNFLTCDLNLDLGLLGSNFQILSHGLRDVQALRPCKVLKAFRLRSQVPSVIKLETNYVTFWDQREIADVSNLSPLLKYIKNYFISNKTIN